MNRWPRLASITGIVLVSVALAEGCYSNIEIQSPAESRKHITTPYDLEIVHTGCGSAVVDSLEVWLDKGMERQEDISDAFTYGADTWTAPDYALPLDSHTLTVQAGVAPGLFCRIGREGDTREFFVSEPTCTEGRILAYHETEDPSQAGPPPARATIEIRLSQDQELVAKAMTDEDGSFCIDDIPMGFLVDIRVFIEDPMGVGYAFLAEDGIWSLEGFDPGLTMDRSCAKDNCADAFAAFCANHPEQCKDGGPCIPYRLVES